MADGDNKASEIVLLKSEIEAAAARVAERALNETWTGASGFLGDVFGGLVGDRTKLWRTRNLVDMLSKTYAHLMSKGVNIDAAKSLPMGELLVIFEGSSRTDDFDLSSMWAALLSNGMNPTKDTFVDPSFPRLLSNLSGLDARILKYVSDYDSHLNEYSTEAELLWAGLGNWDTKSPEFTATDEANKRLLKTLNDKAAKLTGEFRDGHSEEHLSYSLTNLLRLGLLIAPDNFVPHPELIEVEVDYNENVVVNTARLKLMLEDLKENIRLGYETKKELLEVSTNDPFMSEAIKPTYVLSGYAKRFLNACT